MMSSTTSKARLSLAGFLVSAGCALNACADTAECDPGDILHEGMCFRASELWPDPADSGAGGQGGEAGQSADGDRSGDPGQGGQSGGS